jgi:peptidoglycan/xylan/chitin deacetylase (PgdA/CDA1 family)
VAGLGAALPLGSAGCAGSAAGIGLNSSPGAAAVGTATSTGTAASAADNAAAAATTASATGAVIELAHATGVTNAVALTFHGDGPPQLAQELLAEAERAGAQVTVLAVGQWLDAYPTMARRVLDGGHELGNHTEHHIDISALSAGGAYTEIETCAARLRKLTGSQGRWFRPSQARHATAAVRAAAGRAGYRDVLSYDLDPLDYTDPGSAAVVRNVLSAVAPGDVVSLHLGHRGTIEALPAILDGLRARGLRPVTADSLFSDGIGPSPRATPSQEVVQH